MFFFFCPLAHMYTCMATRDAQDSFLSFSLFFTHSGSLFSLLIFSFPCLFFFTSCWFTNTSTIRFPFLLFWPSYLTSLHTESLRTMLVYGFWVYDRKSWPYLASGSTYLCHNAELRMYTLYCLPFFFMWNKNIYLPLKEGAMERLVNSKAVVPTPKRNY